MNLIEKKERNSFIARYAVAIVIGSFSTYRISLLADEIYRVNWVPFELAFIYGLSTTLIPLGIQWMLLDKFLAKTWFVAGGIGAIIAAIEHGFVIKILQDYRYEAWITNLQAIDHWFLFIALATFLQSYSIRNKFKNSYWWVIANVVGMGLNFAMSNLLYWTGLRPYTLATPGFIQLALMILNELPFGILCGLFLYRLVQDLNVKVE